MLVPRPLKEFGAAGAGEVPVLPRVRAPGRAACMEGPAVMTVPG